MALGLGIACGDGERPDDAPRAMGDARVGGGVVSTVDGHAITVAEVEQLVRRSGLSAHGALTRLQERELLAAEAGRRGYGRRRAVQREVRKLLAQLVLERDVERVVTAESVTEQAIRAAYERDLSRYQSPERRASIHVLCAAAPGASERAVAQARALCERAHAALAAAADPAAQLREWMATQRFEGREVRVEEVPAASRDEPGWALEYLEALFAPPQPGLAPFTRSADFGFHALVVTEIVAAQDLSLEDASPRIREELVQAARFEALQRLLSELEARLSVQRDEAAIEAVVGRDLVQNEGS